MKWQPPLLIELDSIGVFLFAAINISGIASHFGMSINEIIQTLKILKGEK